MVPLGMEFSNADIVKFMIQLKPNVILALPSFVVILAEYVSRNQALSILGLSKCVTGGEMMLPAMQAKIRDALGVSEFLSTGYTSNETGAIGFPCRLLLAL